MLGKKLKQTAEAACPNHSFYLIKKDGIITVGRKRLAWVKPAADKTYELFWDNALVSEIGMDKQLVRSHLDASAAGSAFETQWELYFAAAMRAPAPQVWSHFGTANTFLRTLPSSRKS